MRLKHMAIREHRTNINIKNYDETKQKKQEKVMEVIHNKNITSTNQAEQSLFRTSYRDIDSRKWENSLQIDHLRKH